MCQFLRSHKNLILLFFLGFFIGVLLEIHFVERRKSDFFFKPEAFDQSIQVTCLVLIKHSHLRYVNTSSRTWLKHCDDYHIVDIKKPDKFKKQPFWQEDVENSKEDEKACRNGVNVKRVVGQNGWSALCKAIHLAKTSNPGWLIVVPDSVIVLVENLKLFVKDMDVEGRHYFGYPLKHYEADYNIMSAGVLLSHGAIENLLKLFENEEDCDLSGKYWRNEDLYLGKYLKKLGIFPRDTRDEEGRGRFHGYNLNTLLWPGKLFNQSDYIRKALHPVSHGFQCCSPHLITLDVSDPDAMYNLYYFLYFLRTGHKAIPTPVKFNGTKNSYWKEFLRKEGYNESEIENMSSEEYYNIWERKLPLDVMYNEMRRILKNRKEEA